MEKELRPGRYRHFKGQEYRLIGLAHHSETLELLVVYQALYDDQALWVRPVEMWQELVEKDDQMIPRFTYIGEE